MHCCVVGWSFPSMGVCHTLLDEDPGVPEGNKQHWWFPIVAYTWPTFFLHHHHPPLPPPPKKNTCHCLMLWEHCFWLFGGESSDAIPCTVIMFPNQSDETSFHHTLQCCEAITFNSIHFHSCKVTFFSLWNLCFSVSKWGTQRARTFWFSKLCCHFPDFDSLWWASSICPLFQERQFACTTLGLISNICVHL